MHPSEAGAAESCACCAPSASTYGSLLASAVSSESDSISPLVASSDMGDLSPALHSVPSRIPLPKLTRPIRRGSHAELLASPEKRSARWAIPRDQTDSPEAIGARRRRSSGSQSGASLASERSTRHPRSRARQAEVETSDKVPEAEQEEGHVQGAVILQAQADQDATGLGLDTDGTSKHTMGHPNAGPVGPKTEDDWCDLLASYVSQNLLTQGSFFTHDFSASYRPESGSSTRRSRKYLEVGIAHSDFATGDGQRSGVAHRTSGGSGQATIQAVDLRKNRVESQGLTVNVAGEDKVEALDGGDHDGEGKGGRRKYTAAPAPRSKEDFVDSEGLDDAASYDSVSRPALNAILGHDFSSREGSATQQSTDAGTAAMFAGRPGRLPKYSAGESCPVDPLDRQLGDLTIGDPSRVKTPEQDRAIGAGDQGGLESEPYSDPWTRATARETVERADDKAAADIAQGRASTPPEEETFQDPGIPDMVDRPSGAQQDQRKQELSGIKESNRSRRTLARRLGQPQSSSCHRVSGDDMATRNSRSMKVSSEAASQSELFRDRDLTQRKIDRPRQPAIELPPSNPYAHKVEMDRPAIDPLQGPQEEDITLRPDAPSHHAQAIQEITRQTIIPGHPVTSGTPSTSHTESPLHQETQAAREKHGMEAHFMKDFFDREGYMPAPQQSPASQRRRLRTIRRLGLDGEAGDIHRDSLDRFTRLACSIFKAKMATVTIVGKKSQLFPSEIGLNVRTMGLELGLCTHTSLSEREVLVISDAAEDWRFRNHPMVLQGRGPIRFYAGAPLTFGEADSTCTIGTLCVIDDKPRHNWSPHDSAVLIDLATCVLGDMELMFQERQKELSSVMHQVTVDFLRQSLQGQTTRQQVRERNRNDPSTESSSAQLESFRSNGEAGDGSSRREETLAATGEKGSGLYQECCNILLHTLSAHAVAIVDLSRFHVYFPNAQEDGNSIDGTTGAGSSSIEGSRTSGARDVSIGYRSYMSSVSATSAASGSADPNRARALHGLDTRKVPAVEFVPRTLPAGVSSANDADQEKITVLGQSYSEEGLSFNFDSPTSRRTIANFIAQNLATRKVWYERNDSPLIAASLTEMMPEGTHVSLTSPAFDYAGQAAFCVAVCWCDPLHTYDKATISFVENLSGSLLANTLRTRLSAMEQSQRAFAAFASHQWRTPLHQMMTTTSLMRQLIAYTPPATPAPRTGEYFSRPQTAQEIQLAQKNQDLALMLDTLESSGRSLQDTLNDILDFLDVGSASAGKQEGQGAFPDTSEGRGMDMDALLNEAIMDAQAAEFMLRNATGRDARRLEIVCEVVPRSTGDWMVLRDFGPLKRACNKLITNSLFATTSGYVSVVVEDISHRSKLPGYDTSLAKSIVRITIEDSGSGMDPTFAAKDIFRPFAKEDKFSPGSGLGVTLTQRILHLMGGEIRFESHIGKGTTCTIEVPLFIRDSPDGMSDKLTPGDGLPPMAVLGFDGQSDVGLDRVNDSLKRQLRAGGCEVVPHFDGASIFICEEEYDVLGAHPDLARRNPADVKVVMLGSAVSPRVQRLDNPTKLGDTKIAVWWLFRPLLPEIIERIFKIGRTSALKDEVDTAQIMPSPPLSPQSVNTSNEEVTTINPPEHAQRYREPPSPLPGLTEDPIPKGEDGRLAMSPVPKSNSPSDTPPEIRLRRDSAEQPIFTVLVVEDNAINRRLLVGLVKRMKIVCSEAVDGGEAVTKFIEARPSLVLLDINMPVKNGFEAASAIRKHERQNSWPRCKIIAVTALSAERDKRRGMIESGIDEWVTKPVGVKNLKSSIEALRATRGKVDQDDAEEAMEKRQEKEEEAEQGD